MGMTPKDVLWKRGKIQLYRYHAQTASLKPIPYFIVPWLGISRPYVLDMLPGHSMIEFLVQHGYDVYMLDWVVFAKKEKTSVVPRSSVPSSHALSTAFWKLPMHRRLL